MNHHIAQLLPWVIAVFLYLPKAFTLSIDQFNGPGSYRVQGRVEYTQKNGELRLRVFGNSRSAVSLLIQFKNQNNESALFIKALSLHHRKAQVYGVIPTAIKQYSGIIQISQIRMAAGDPLDPSEGDGFWKLRE